MRLCQSVDTLPQRIEDSLRSLRVPVRLGNQPGFALEPSESYEFRFVLAPVPMRKAQRLIVLYQRRLLFDIKCHADKPTSTELDVDLGFFLEIRTDSSALNIYRWGELVIRIDGFRVLNKRAMRTALMPEFYSLVWDAVRVYQNLPSKSPLHTSRPLKPLEGVIYARPANAPPPRFRPLDVDYDRVDYRGEVFEFSVEDILPEPSYTSCKR